MVFQCQRDSFQTEFVTKITKIDTNEETVEVICEDTILFPKGGGQPHDLGLFIKSGGEKFEVKDVIRRHELAIHIFDKKEVGEFLNINDEIKQVVDWQRRFDHMQQHSGQHLISSLLEQEFNNGTKSWWLGADESYIELEKKLEVDDMQKIEKMCNDLIRKAIAVDVKIYNTPEEAGNDATRASRGLPEDLAGPIRVIQIGDIDKNLCCGTHVTNLAQLQVIKFLFVEKAKDKILLHFLVGNRVMAKLNSCFQRELQLNTLLNNGPDDHIELVKKLQATIKSNQKTIQRLSKENATTLATKLNNEDDPKPYYFLHRNDGVEMDFVNTFLKQAKPKKPTFFFITIADAIDSKSGSLLIQGTTEDVDSLSVEITSMLEGKGNGKNGRFQSKVTNLKRIKDCEKFVQKYFENKV